MAAADEQRSRDIAHAAASADSVLRDTERRLKEEAAQARDEAVAAAQQEAKQLLANARREEKEKGSEEASRRVDQEVQAMQERFEKMQNLADAKLQAALKAAEATREQSISDLEAKAEANMAQKPRRS